MNATVRTILVFVLLVGAVVVASLVYRRSVPATAAGPAGAGAIPGPIDESSLHPELKLGLDAANEDRGQDAIRHFRAVPADSNNYPTALRHLAILAAREGDYDDAIASLLQLTKQRPDDPEVHASLGWVFYLAEHYNDAEYAALRVLELDPSHVSTRFNLALYRIAQGRNQLAISSYIRAMRADPNGKQVTRHRDRLRFFHDEHLDRPTPHYALAFFADSMQDPRTEIDELEHYLELATAGPEKDAAEEQLEQARAEVGGV
ncbi:MAG: tetratricopeptide repeat protein [Acidobacteria bacterium]|nr:tetratricopeptide repeat protein [Acidobacteriota bacterium]